MGYMMTTQVLVVGHKNPDTDSVISAIVLAELLRFKGVEAVPARAGDLRPETKVILKRVGLKNPLLVVDVRPRVADVMTKGVKFVYRGTPVRRAGELLVTLGIRSVPVVDSDMRVIGLFSVESFSRAFFKDFINVRITLSNVPLKNIADAADCKVIYGDLNKLISGQIYVGAMDIKTIRERFSFKGNVVIVGDRKDVQLEAINSGASLLIITGGLTPSEDVIEIARRVGVPILLSPYDTYTTARLVDLSRPVELFVERAEKVSALTPIHEVIELMSRRIVRSVVVVDDDDRLVGIVTRSDLIKDYRRRVALVDHNERVQAVDGIDDADVVAVVDHHRVSGDIKTREPILFRVEPVGSTATILWKVMREWGVSLSMYVLEALLYAVLSDTLILKSPTTTDDDRSCINSLLTTLGLKLDDVIQFMRQAISVSEPREPHEVVNTDVKTYEVRGFRLAIAQVLTANPNNYLLIKDKLINEMERARKVGNLHLYLLAITDYVDESSYILVSGDVGVVEEAFNTKVEGNCIYLRGVTSRKLQILPPLIKVLEERAN